MTRVDRRQFIASVGATAAVGVSASGALRPTGASWSGGGKVTANDLEPHVGQSFRVLDPNTRQSAQLVLLEVTSKDSWERTHTNRPRPKSLPKPFTVLFKLKGSQSLESGYHQIQHPVLGKSKVLLTAVCHKGRHFEVCFC